MPTLPIPGDGSLKPLVSHDGHVLEPDRILDPEHHQFGMIAAVLLRLFYLIFWHVLGPVLLMGTASSVQHVGRGRAPIPM